MRPFMGMTLSRKWLAASGSMHCNAAIPRAEMARFMDRSEAPVFAGDNRMSTFHTVH